MHLVGQGLALPNSTPADAPTNRARSRRRRLGPDRAGPPGRCTCRRPSRAGRRGSGSAMAATATNMRGTCRPAARPAARSSAWSGSRARPARSHRHPGRDEGGAAETLAVTPTGWPNQVPSGTTMWPGVMRLRVAGSDDDGGEDGDEQPHPLDEEPQRQARGPARPSVRTYRAASTASWRISEAAMSSTEQRHQLHPRVEALQQARAAAPCRRRRSPGAATLAPPSMVLSTSCPCGAGRCSRTGTARSRPGSASAGVGCAAGRWRPRSCRCHVDVVGGSRPVAAGRRPLRADEPDRTRNDGQGDHRDADAGRGQVAERRVLRRAEAVAVEQGVAPEPVVVVRPDGMAAGGTGAGSGRRRGLAERAARGQQPERGQHHEQRRSPISAPAPPTRGRLGVGRSATSGTLSWLMRRIGRLARCR